MVSLAILIAAKGKCDPRPMSDALHAAGALADGAVDVRLICDPQTVFRCEPTTAFQVERLSEPQSIFQLWGFGVTAAQATYVAILDIHCPPAEGWFNAVMARLASDPVAFYGPVEPAYPWEDRRIAGYLAEYVQFHRPLAPGLGEVAGSNLIVSRVAALQAVDSSGAFIKTRLLTLLPTLPTLNPNAVVLYGKPFEFQTYLVRRYSHGRSYAAQRYAKFPWRRPMAAVSAACLPILRVWRIRRHAQRHPQAAAAFRQRLGLLLIAEAAWSIGEFLGYLTGEAVSATTLD